MVVRVAPLFSFRTLATLLLAALLFVRLGPLCETAAMAATPVASAMPGCADQPHDTPAKKMQPAACAMSCMAACGEVVTYADVPSYGAIVPWPAVNMPFDGTSRAPDPPPPRMA